MTFTLPPTADELRLSETRPYFLWWSAVTVGELGVLLRSPDLDERAYWMGAILREANTRDVWLFVTPAEVRALWPQLLRHLGRTRERWAYLLGVDPGVWPPLEARDA